MNEALPLLCIDQGNSRASVALFSPSGQRMLRFDGMPAESGDASSWLDFLSRGSGDADGFTAAICSVVPPSLSSLIEACAALSGSEPFVLSPLGCSLLDIRYADPSRLGADRVAAAIAARARHPGRDLIVMDLGSACTVDAITEGGSFLGGAIFPGPSLQAFALSSGTRCLPPVEMEWGSSTLGRSTEECMRSGISRGLLGALREISIRLKKECFSNNDAVIIATGGWTDLYPPGEESLPWDECHPDLVLEGCRLAALAQEKGE